MNKLKEMKCILVCTAIIFSIWLQVNSQAKDAPIDYYPGKYDTLSQEDWPAMKETFNFFLGFKSLQEINNYTDPLKASFTLARMAKIDWDESLKKEISSYLTYFLNQLLNGRSYLHIDSTRFPQYESIHNPIYLPHNIIWALFQIDNEAAFEIIRTYWTITSSLAITSYQEDLRKFTLWLFETTNNKTAREFFMDNYPLLKNNLSGTEKNIISAIKLKCEISRINDQKLAWEYLWNNSKLDNSNVYNNKTQFLWYHNILMMKSVFQDLDIKTIINISDTTSSANKKYLFLYSACFNINDKLSTDPNYKIDRSVINYIERSIKKIESQNTQLKALNIENDFLLTTYDSMKSNLLKKGE
jgi:hypothetical protein